MHKQQYINIVVVVNSLYIRREEEKEKSNDMEVDLTTLHTYIHVMYLF